MPSSKRPAPKEHNPSWFEAHRTACEHGAETYIDPESGYSVFTEVALKKRGYCCESGCRHCPYWKEEE